MITAKNLKKRYADFSLQVDFEIPEGRITGLVGKNGAGKSTTIKLLLGLVRSDESGSHLLWLFLLREGEALLPG